MASSGSPSRFKKPLVSALAAPIASFSGLPMGRPVREVAPLCAAPTPCVAYLSPIVRQVVALTVNHCSLAAGV